MAAALPALVAKAARDRAAVRAIEKDEIGSVNYEIERIRLERRKLDYLQRQRAARDFTAERRSLDSREAEQQAELRDARGEARQADADGGLHARRVQDRRRPGEGAAGARHRTGPTRPTSCPGPGEPRSTRAALWAFLTDEPRESNTEGGIFPAIFGTVMMMFLMSLAVVPLGVLAALYLREYAKQGPLVRMVRIAVNNLAGVPSIVFGVFGLGFFVYFVGGSDRPAVLPGGAADADLRHRRHPLGLADAGAAHGARW